MSGKTIIQYYIPEDGDELEHPNVYMLEKKETGITLKDIKSTFPILGTYYFRFKRSFKKTWIWYDVNDLEEVVPAFEGSIMMKVTRLPASAAKKMESVPKRESKRADSTVTSKSTPSPKPIPKPVESRKSTPVSPAEDFLSSVNTASASTTPSTSGDIFDTFSAFSKPAQPADPWASLGI